MADPTWLEFIEFVIISFVFGAMWGYYTGAVNWRSKYLSLKSDRDKTNNS